MKKILSLILLSTLLFSCKTNIFHQQEVDYKTSNDFVQGSEDIPLLVGMKRISEDAIGFDTSSGSIINSSYSTAFDIKEIKEFYLQTLPVMGWKIVKESKNKITFNRDEEKLEINFKQRKKDNLVTFFLIS